MLTISQKALEFARATGTANIDFATYHFQHGAAWANEQNAQEIAELKKELVHTIEEVDSYLIGQDRLEREIAELVAALRRIITKVPAGDHLEDLARIDILLAKYEK